EDPLPAEGVGQRAADQRADRDGAADGRAPDAERGPALASVEFLRQQGERRREHGGASDALEAAGEVEQGGIAREPAEERGEAEDGDAGRERAPAPKPIGQRPGGEQESGERQGV